MDNLEKYIKERKSHFYEKDVPKGHEMRFAEKLRQGSADISTTPKDQNAKIPFWRKPLFQVAVVALLFVGSVAIFKSVNIQDAAIQTAQLPAELQEVESFYLVKCEKELTHFKTYYSANSPVDIAKELEELEKEYKELKKEMVKQPGNERIMAALVKNLQLRLQLLQQINRLMKKEEPQIITL